METKAKLTPAEIRAKVHEHLERQKCASKQKFNDQRSAEGQCHHYNTAGNRKPEGKKNLYPYKCRWCAFWHTSANPPRAQ